jgi:ABC-type multidrug transport system permease subunit
MNNTAMEKDDSSHGNNNSRLKAYYFCVSLLITVGCIVGLYYLIKVFMLDISPDSTFIPMNVFILSFGLPGFMLGVIVGIITAHKSITEILGVVINK